MQALGLVWDDVDNLSPDVDEIHVPIPAPAHFGGRLLFDIWRERRVSGGLVVGRDVPSRALAPVLRNLAVYEPLDKARDFRVRLAGSALIRRFGCDITGLKLSELLERKPFGYHRDAMTNVLATNSPRAIDVRLQSGGRTQLHFEVLNLPVLAPNRKTPWVLGGLFYSDWTK